MGFSCPPELLREGAAPRPRPQFPGVGRGQRSRRAAWSRIRPGPRGRGRAPRNLAGVGAEALGARRRASSRSPAQPAWEAAPRGSVQTAGLTPSRMPGAACPRDQASPAPCCLSLNLSRIQPQHGDCFLKENDGFCLEPSTTSESLLSDTPRALHASAASASCCSSCGCKAQRSHLTSVLPPLACPAACHGVQDQGRHPEALQGLLPREEAWAVVHLLQNESKAQAEADVAPLSVKLYAKLHHFLGKWYYLFKGNKV